MSWVQDIPQSVSFALTLAMNTEFSLFPGWFLVACIPLHSSRGRSSLPAALSVKPWGVGRQATCCGVPRERACQASQRDDCYSDYYSPHYSTVIIDEISSHKRY